MKGGNRAPQNGDFRGGTVLADEKARTTTMGGWGAEAEEIIVDKEEVSR